jgi:CBS domain containing-hemolysin-like protein
MDLEKIKKNHSHSFFTRYPVVDRKNRPIGVFNIEVFYWRLIIKKDENWQNHINKEVIYFSPDEKLDKVLSKLKRRNCRLAFVKEKERIIGIVTLHDVLSTLVGKIKDEREALLFPRLLN